MHSFGSSQPEVTAINLDDLEGMSERELKPTKNHQHFFFFLLFSQVFTNENGMEAVK